MGPVGGGVPDDFSVRLHATLVPPESGAWTFSVVQAGRARVLLDGEVFLDNWNPTERGEAFYGMGSAELAETVDLVAGQRYELVVEAIPAAPALGGLSVGLEPPAARRPHRTGGRGRAHGRRGRLRRRLGRPVGDRGQRPRVDDAARRAGRARARGRGGEPAHRSSS